MDLFLSIFSSVQYGIALVAFVWMASIFVAPRLKVFRTSLFDAIRKTRTILASSITFPIL
jgi:hypothetical protein